MSALAEGHSIEADIAECWHALYWASEPQTALQHWARLRELNAIKTRAECEQFIREARVESPPPAPLR